MLGDDGAVDGGGGTNLYAVIIVQLYVDQMRMTSCGARYSCSPKDKNNTSQSLYMHLSNVAERSGLVV